MRISRLIVNALHAICGFPACISAGTVLRAARIYYGSLSGDEQYSGRVKGWPLSFFTLSSNNCLVLMRNREEF